MATKIWLGTDTGNVGKWATAANWSPSGVPANGDDVYLINSSQDVTADWDQSAVALNSLNIAQSFTGKIGDASNYLQIGASSVRIGYNDGPGTPAGSSLLKLDLGNTTAPTVVIENSGVSSDDEVPPILLLVVNAAAVIEARKGKVGIAFDPSESSTVGTIVSSYVNQKSADADVYIGEGVTLTTLNIKGGDVILPCGVTTINGYDGTLKTVGSGAIAAINAKGTVMTLNSTGTITTLIITGGTADFSKSSQARTVTTLKLDDKGKLIYDPNVVTITNKVDSNDPVILQASAA